MRPRENNYGTHTHFVNRIDIRHYADLIAELCLVG